VTKQESIMESLDQFIKSALLAASTTVDGIHLYLMSPGKAPVGFVSDEHYRNLLERFYVTKPAFSLGTRVLKDGDYELSFHESSMLIKVVFNEACLFPQSEAARLEINVKPVEGKYTFFCLIGQEAKEHQKEFIQAGIKAAYEKVTIPAFINPTASLNVNDFVATRVANDELNFPILVMTDEFFERIMLSAYADLSIDINQNGVLHRFNYSKDTRLVCSAEIELYIIPYAATPRKIDPVALNNDRLMFVVLAKDEVIHKKIKKELGAVFKMDKHTCKVCYKTSTEKCSQCKAAHYCSRECQKKDWKEHKKICLLKDKGGI
jgi:hypothetical protein